MAAEEFALGALIRIHSTSLRSAIRCLLSVRVGDQWRRCAGTWSAAQRIKGRVPAAIPHRFGRGIWFGNFGRIGFLLQIETELLS